MNNSTSKLVLAASVALALTVISPTLAQQAWLQEQCNGSPLRRQSSGVTVGNYRLTRQAVAVSATRAYLGPVPAGTVVVVQGEALTCNIIAEDGSFGGIYEFWKTDWGYTPRRAFI